MDVMQPFFTNVDFESGNFDPCDKCNKRFLSDLKGCFYFEEEFNKELVRDDKLVYEVSRRDVPLLPGQLQHCITRIYPGTVGGEFFKTKGHYHKNSESAELYLCLKGRGILNMEEPEGKTSYIRMNRGVWSYIPPGWGHRTINISADVLFIFLSVWPGDAGYDYKTVLEKGFGNIFVREDNNEGFRIICRA